MAAGATAPDGFVELGEDGRAGNGAQGTQPPATELSAGFARFTGDFPGADFTIERAPFVDIRGLAGEAEVREFVVLLGGDDLLVEVAAERGFVFHETQADDFLKAEGMGVGAGREEGVCGLEKEREPGQAFDF